MLDKKVQSKADDCLEPSGVKRWKDGRVIHSGQLDTTTEGIVRICGLITEMTIRAKREGWPGW